MVETQIKPRGIQDPRVLSALERVPRDQFVSEKYRMLAYSDCPLPIECGQTISQPYVVAYMTEILNLGPIDRVLEIGTGSGYQTAILAELVAEVFTIEVHPSLSEQAQLRLRGLGYTNIQFRIGDGHQGWPESAPYDAIIVTAAPEDLPDPLVQQLKLGGKLVIPIGPTAEVQELMLYRRGLDGSLERNPKMPVRFVPLIHGSGLKDPIG